MSLTLSLVQPNFLESSYPRSSSLGTTSSCTLQRHSRRRSSIQHTSLHANENEPPPRPTRSSIVLSQDTKLRPLRSVQSQITQGTTQPAESDAKVERQASNHRLPHPPTFNLSDESLETVPLHDDASQTSSLDIFSDFAELEASDPLLPKKGTEAGAQPTFDTAPFKRWLSKLHRTTSNRKSGSHSSGVISAVRTASFTVAESSILPTKTWFGARIGHIRSSEAGYGSRDNAQSPTNMVLDEAAHSRGVQRRRILEELLESEESYLGDLKVLTNVYFTLLASVCALSPHAKSLVRDNLSRLLEMHENILGELHAAIPHSEYSHGHAKETPAVHYRGHVRWRSADSGITKIRDSRLGRRLRHSVDLAQPPKQNAPGTTTEPRVAARVAEVFERWMPSFFAYEEYSVKYEMMVRDLAATYRTLGTDDAFEKGIEVLSRTLESMNNRGEHGHKGLTFADLVIKPIQRVCKYPLLFTDLLKQTPVSDDPEAHGTLEKVLYRLKETTNEINRASDDTSTRHLIELTWRLQDRLVFADKVHLGIQSQLLGHVILCGVLHVTYQARSGIEGHYMLCALFKSCFVLAAPRKGMQYFDVVAVVPLLTVSIEEPDNGKGLQCHTASFAWKIVFQAENRLFEFLLAACSPNEEESWRKHLHERNAIEDLNSSVGGNGLLDVCALLNLGLKPLGSLYGQAHTLARRISLQRAATVGAKSYMHQVILKQIESPEYSTHSISTSSLPLSRSKSTASAGHLLVIAPRRSERIHLEAALSDVWTKELLPFPGMGIEHSFRASANHVMRKLSMASITSSLSRRSSTLVSSNRPQRPDTHFRPRNPLDFALDLGRSRPSAPLTKPQVKPGAEVKPKAQPQHPRNPTVNFHENPDKFLPPDFQLKDPRLNRAPRKKLPPPAMTDDGANKPETQRTKSLHRLQRSLSAKIPIVKEAAERMRPATPTSPRPGQEPSRRVARGVTLATEKENVIGQKLRRIFV